ncbi:MAG: peptidase M20 [Deltaproteobacteria bacterium]|nr:MAG: peptidase M20 [Deltaproteobacteria bacterium]
MNLTVNKERLARQFANLCEIDSPSRQEANIAAYLRSCFATLGADEIIEDNSAAGTGSDTNNMIVRFNGHKGCGESIFFAAHMDTVQPGVGVRVKREGDIFYSAGDTVLGGDDKSGIASLIELVSVLRETGQPHCPMEFIFTTCEEIGLLGAKNLDLGLIRSKHGIALDSTGINQVIVAAPAANKLKIVIQGLAAHAGSNPEGGINALKLAARVITEIPLGRLDHETTSNLGVLRAGTAQNIVPAMVHIEGEVRSHNQEKLDYYTKVIHDKFQEITYNFPEKDEEHELPSTKFEVINDYPSLSLKKTDRVVQRILAASEKIGVNQKMVVGGGGSDANIFCSRGLPTAIVSCGMNMVHTTDEYCDINDLVEITRLLLAMVTEQG